jgi:hypothetical protein
MPELLVTLGVEALILVFVAAMTLYARRMDVLSGRTFEKSVVARLDNEHPPRSLRRRARDLLPLIRRWFSVPAPDQWNGLRWPDLVRTPRSRHQSRPRT